MKKQNHKLNGINSNAINNFKSVFEKASYGNSYENTFDDFLTMCICAVTRNHSTGLSFYEDEYLALIESYKAKGTIKYFPELFAELIKYMEQYKDDSQGNDLLGTFFEQEISHGRNGQFFTPFHVCLMMSKMNQSEETKSLNVFDPACGSGRMLMAFAKCSNLMHIYYAIDLDSQCVKMTALNLFLNGMRGEVICANTLEPNDYRFGYRVSLFPLGIFKIKNKENSFIWNSQKSVFQEMQERNTSSQLHLF